MYAGEWKCDKYHGRGQEHWNYNSEKYVGDFVDGERTGHGTFTYKNGDKYDGQWHKGKRHGIGY